MSIFLIGISTWFVWLLPGNLFSSDAHAVYVSVLEIKQKTGSEKGVINVKLFSNDLEDAIFNRSTQRIELTETNCEHYKTLVDDYINDHLEFKINGIVQSYHYESCEINDMSIWLNFSFSYSKSWQEMEVKADYLMELFPTQANIVSILYHEQKSMFRLIKGDDSEVIEFSN